MLAGLRERGISVAAGRAEGSGLHGICEAAGWNLEGGADSRREGIVRMLPARQPGAARRVLRRAPKIVRAVPARPVTDDTIRIVAAADAAVVARERARDVVALVLQIDSAGWRSPCGCWARCA